MAQKLTNSKVIELLSELKKSKEDFFDPQNGNFDEVFYKDKEYLTYALLANGKALKFADDTLKSDKEIVSIAVHQDYDAFQYASQNLKMDRDYVYKLSLSRPDMLMYADESILDKEFISLLKERDYEILIKGGPDRFKKDREFVKSAVSENGMLLKYLTDYKNDYEVALAAVEDNGYAYEYISDELRANKNITKAAIRNRGDIIRFAPFEVKADKNLAMIAVSSSGAALECLDGSLKKDEEIVLTALRSRVNVRDAIGEIPSELMENLDFIKKALIECDEVYDHLSSEMKKNPDIKLINKIHSLSSW